MLLQIHPEIPDTRKIGKVIEILRSGGIIIYPTDTVYALGCDAFNQKAVEKICQIRKLDPKKAMLSLICKDISQISEYAWQIDNQLFKLLKRNLPGPFTFILKSGNSVPKLFKNRKRTIGVRIPDNPIALAIVETLNSPLMSASLISEEADETHPYMTDPMDIYDMFGNRVDVVIDGGIGGNEPSTLVNCVEAPYEVIRQGAGILS